VSLQSSEALAVRARVARVDLLPPDIVDARRARRVRFLLAGGVLLVAAACVAAGSTTDRQLTEAQDAVAVEQSRTAQLRAQQAPYAEVPLVLQQLADVQRVSAAVNAYDVPWYSYLDQIAVKSPEDLSLTSLALALADDQSATPDASGSTNPLAVSGVGTLTVGGQTTSQAKVAAWLESMETIPGILAPTLTNSTLDTTNGVVTFTAGATLGADVLQPEQ